MTTKRKPCSCCNTLRLYDQHDLSNCMDCNRWIGPCCLRLEGTRSPILCPSCREGRIAAKLKARNTAADSGCAVDLVPIIVRKLEDRWRNLYMEGWETEEAEKIVRDVMGGNL